MNSLPVVLVLALGACADFDAGQAVSDIRATMIHDAWHQANEAAVKAIVERCQPGPPTPEEWYFRLPEPGPSQLRSLGPTTDGHPPGSASAEHVDRCIDEGIQALPPFPEAGKRFGVIKWIVRLRSP